MHDGSETRQAAQQHAVIIAGGGPTGLMLAGELALANVDVAIVERRATQELTGARAGGLQARTIEVLDQRGIAERFLSHPAASRIAGFAAKFPLDISDVPTRHPFALGLWQTHIERLLAEWVAELGVTTYRGREVTDLAQDDGGVDVALSDETSMRAQYLVGCDGGRSAVRKKAGIAFPGWDASVSYLIAEFEATEPVPQGVRHGERGVNGVGKLDDRRVRAVLVEPEVVTGADPSLEDLRAALVAVYGTDFGAHSPTWLSRFSDAARQADRYRAGRVLVAGDAAHVHSPTGGQGLNTGVQDAVNLGWKLAQVVHGTAPATLLDTYHAERHPIGARVLRLTFALTALARGDARSEALRDILEDVLQMPEPHRKYAAMFANLDIHYDLGAGHPLLGRRMPDLEVDCDGESRRVSTLLHAARPVLLNLGARGALDVGPWSQRIRLVDGRYPGRWELPVIGDVPAPSAVLIRPDGHVAWVGDGGGSGGDDDRLREALAKWFGPPVGA